MKRTVLLFLVLGVLATLAACGGKPGGETPVQMDLNAVYASISQTVQIPEMLELNQDLMLDYCGIHPETVKRAKVLICEDSLRTDEIWLVEAVDEAAAKTVAELATKRLEKKGEESITYSPEQYAVVEKAELVQHGRYVGLFVSPDSAEMAKLFRSAAGIQ